MQVAQTSWLYKIELTVLEEKKSAKWAIVRMHHVQRIQPVWIEKGMQESLGNPKCLIWILSIWWKVVLQKLYIQLDWVHVSSSCKSHLASCPGSATQSLSDVLEKSVKLK